MVALQHGALAACVLARYGQNPEKRARHLTLMTVCKGKKRTCRAS